MLSNFEKTEKTWNIYLGQMGEQSSGLEQRLSQIVMCMHCMYILGCSVMNVNVCVESRC